MKAALAALACVLTLASAAAADLVHPPLDALDHARPAPTGTHPPHADPSAVDGKRQETGKAPLAAVETIKARSDVQPAREPPKPHQDVAHRESWRARVCFNASETREKIATHRLAAPFQVLRAGRQQGEALRAKLCKWKQDEFVYEISVLRRDGRIVRVFMNAQSGQSVGALDDVDRR